jgi:3-dehydroquinate synthase
MKKINLKIKETINSEIIISQNIDINSIIKKIDYDKKLLITDQKIYKIFREKIKKLPIFLIENHREKDLSDIKKMVDYLLKNNFSRKSLLIAFGGGRITDTVGFCASIYMRGIKWIDIPTTALSQIDASVGGKTGVDFNGAKNILGRDNTKGSRNKRYKVFTFFP